MHWNIQYKPRKQKVPDRIEEIMQAILRQRSIIEPEDLKVFHSPPDPLQIEPAAAGLDETVITAIQKRLQAAADNSQPVLVFGDYDADGITATAILWEALHAKGIKTYPFIPHREKHGYGLSVAGIKDALKSLKKDSSLSEKPLIITVDNGIVAHEAADYAHQLGIELIITDHHQKGASLPKHSLLLHSDQIAGSGVAWFLAKAIAPAVGKSTLELVTIGTVADIMPLKGVNRAIVRRGLEALRKSQRPGIRALFQEAGVDLSLELSTYHIGFILAPRLNAMGRLDDAMDSLRLLCTTNQERAQKLAQQLADTNRTRQDITLAATQSAAALIQDPSDSLILVDHAEFHEGIIGLIAGKLTEKHYRPSIVISRGSNGISKASARSISGVNIIELIRSHEDLLVNAGGHPMAAGFSIETKNIELFREKLLAYARANISTDVLKPVLSIDCELLESDISWELFEQLENLKPFGMGNSRPLFSLRNVRIGDARTVGKGSKHLKVRFQSEDGSKLEAIGFNLGHKLEEMRKNTHANAAFSLDQNTWNGNTTLQLKLKDVQ